MLILVAGPLTFDQKHASPSTQRGISVIGHVNFKKLFLN